MQMQWVVVSVIFLFWTAIYMHYVADRRKSERQPKRLLPSQRKIELRVTMDCSQTSEPLVTSYYEQIDSFHPNGALKKRVTRHYETRSGSESGKQPSDGKIVPFLRKLSGAATVIVGIVRFFLSHLHHRV